MRFFGFVFIFEGISNVRLVDQLVGFIFVLQMSEGRFILHPNYHHIAVGRLIGGGIGFFWWINGFMSRSGCDGTTEHLPTHTHT